MNKAELGCFFLYIIQMSLTAEYKEAILLLSLNINKSIPLGRGVNVWGSKEGKATQNGCNGNNDRQ